ncbi:hypothetical protein QBC32DRAFT_211904 [Pseudoneurospora amorphoporcata]|uniref:WHIM1 domain-containing protein n=1 Tax=Pseudoneurospora amorphoporcata TaxID=241081 RepID=A0AAN6NVB1_9PEZI|nr:hypothetical protein QBC32DRAFT_211904 [Pseudoneurospora amorphoporcata]
MADDDSSDLSSISSLSAPPTDDEADIEVERHQGILKFFHKVDKNPALNPSRETTPPRRKREPSPPHEYVLADNPDIAFIVMFRARFTEAFPKSLANFGPQELERDVVETIPGERVENFLCAVLGLMLNRKQDVKAGHYGRALEEAIQTHKNQWAKEWEGQNPLAGGATFASMTPVQRLALLRTLIHWTLASSDVVKTMINKNYRTRHEDDLNVGLSVQPWGTDGDKRRYYLIEGNDDTHFRVYRESNPAGHTRTWWSVAGNIEELKVLAEKLEKNDGGPKARALAKRISNSIPRFEATEEKRRRREYRIMRKEQFKRPEPGLSLYEGRTRGKRMKYTFSDDEDDFYTDSTATRRSTRNTRNHTPAEPAGPFTTASGRQVRAPTRFETTASNPASAQGDEDVEMTGGVADAKKGDQVELTVGPTGRPRRSAAVHHTMNGWSSAAATAGKKKRSKADDYDSDEEDEASEEPDFGDDEEDEHLPAADDEEEDEEDEEEYEEDADMADEDDLVDGDDAKDDDDDHDNSLVFKFPIRVGFDENAKVTKVDGPPLSPTITHKHPRTAHRNIVVSEESTPAQSRGQSVGDGKENDMPMADADDELAVKDEIVAIPLKKATAEPLVEKGGGGIKRPLSPPPGLGPPGGQQVLPIRSPEKPQPQKLAGRM